GDMTRPMVFTAALLFYGAEACADTVSTYVDGRHYSRSDTEFRVSAEEGRVEVVEVFSYDCEECLHLWEWLDAWADKRRDDVRLIRVPAVISERHELYARAFYTAHRLHLPTDVHESLF